MPNWCANTVTIKGPVDQIRAIWDDAHADKDGGLLQALRPMPAALQDTVKGTGDEAQTQTHDGFTNWYDWAVSQWGTKWDIDIEYLNYDEHNDGTASITGGADSAWSPPIEAFQAYANENPDVYLELKYFEPGMSFIGIWDSEGGDAYWEDIYGLVKSKADEEDTVLAELFEEFNVWECYDWEDEEIVDAAAE